MISIHIDNILAIALSIDERATIYTEETEYQNGEQEIRVLLPDNYREDKQFRVLYVLPVEVGFQQYFGYGLGVLQEMNAHNVYDIIIVQMGSRKNRGLETMPLIQEYAKQIM